MLLPFQENHMLENYRFRLLFENNSGLFVYLLVHLYPLVNTADLIQPVKISTQYKQIALLLQCFNCNILGLEHLLC